MKIMSNLLRKFTLVCASAASLLPLAVHAQQQPVGPIFYILMENRNFTEGSDNSVAAGSQLVGNSAAPYINSLITPNNANATFVSYCTAYHNVLSVSNTTGAIGANSIHPSEPNYVWFECGSNLSKTDDNDPYGSGKSVQQIATFLANNPSLSGQNISGLLQAAGFTWKAYAEGTNLVTTASANSNTATGNLTVTPEVESLWTVPLASFSGKNVSYLNPYNNSTQWNFACKHTGSLFFTDTNGSNITTPNTATTNPFSANYPPLAQLTTDLNNNTVAQFNVITPDQFNDMHTALSSPGFNYHGTQYTGDLAQVAQGDNFLSIVVPQIMASQAFQNNGVIVIWTDETEGVNQNDFNHTLMEIVISKLAKGNAYASNLNYTHSTDLNTLQKLFQVTANTPTGFLNDAANPSNSSNGQTGIGFGTGTAFDLSDLFVPNVVPSTIPTMKITPSGFVLNRRTNMLTQTVTITNLLTSAITGPVYIAAGGLSTNTALTNKAGMTSNAAPAGSPYVMVTNGNIAAGASVTVNLQFSVPTSGGISDNLFVFAGTP